MIRSTKERRKRATALHAKWSKPESVPGVMRLTKGRRTRGYLLTAEAFDNLVEDMEALGSASYLASIREADRDIAAGRTYTLAEIKRRYRIR